MDAVYGINSILFVLSSSARPIDRDHVVGCLPHRRVRRSGVKSGSVSHSVSRRTGYVKLKATSTQASVAMMVGLIRRRVLTQLTDVFHCWSSTQLYLCSPSQQAHTEHWGTSLCLWSFWLCRRCAPWRTYTQIIKLGVVPIKVDTVYHY